MAKKNENVINLVDTFQEFKELKNIDRTTICLLYTSPSPRD